MKFLPLLFFASILMACNSQKQATADTYVAPPSETEAAAPARAGQPRSNPTERADAQTAELVDRLQLTSDQEVRVREINRRYAEQNATLTRANAGDRRATFSQLRENMQAKDQEIEAVLTDAQKPEYRRMQEERRAQLRERMQNRGGGRRGRN